MTPVIGVPLLTGKGRFRASCISVSGLMPNSAKMVAATSSGRTAPVSGWGAVAVGRAEAQVLKLRYFTMDHAAARNSAGKAAASRRCSLAMPPGVFNRCERYFSSRPSHS